MATTGIFIVLGSGDLMQAPSPKSPNGFIYRRSIRLQEYGGASRLDTDDKKSNALVATLFGKQAQTEFKAGTMVLASLRTSIKLYQDLWFMDIIVTDISKLK